MKVRALIFLLIPLIFNSCNRPGHHVRTIDLAEYTDKMQAAWIGQMAGVGWGGPTEFHWTGEIIPADRMPGWEPPMINQYGQDDIYVEMTFLKTLEDHGMDVGIRQAGIDFANTGYFLWAANMEGRSNLRQGIAPPASSHPQYSDHCDDIDYQIESDFSGIIAPGLPEIPVRLGEIFGRLMNYGDGMYAGQFIGGMYTEAFFEDDVEKIIEAGLKCIPEKSQYAECMRDVLNWYREDPVRWQETWKKIEKKYFQNPVYQRFAHLREDAWPHIDAKLNGSYILMGLLYGKGNPDSTIVISTRCGRDSDCNPSNAAGILFTTIGFEKLPDKYKSGLNRGPKFRYTEYDFDRLVQVCEKLARENVVQAGGEIRKDRNGDEQLLIPDKKPVPGEFVQSWEPRPLPSGVRYSGEEMAQIKYFSYKSFESLMKDFSPGWQVYFCGKKGDTLLHDSRLARKNVLVTAPAEKDRGVMLRYSPDENNQTKSKWLAFDAGHDPGKEWILNVRINEETIRETISDETAPSGWKFFRIPVPGETGRPRITITAELSGDEPVRNYWSNLRLLP